MNFQYVFMSTQTLNQASIYARLSRQLFTRLWTKGSITALKKGRCIMVYKIKNELFHAMAKRVVKDDMIRQMLTLCNPYAESMSVELSDREGLKL